MLAHWKRINESDKSTGLTRREYEAAIKRGEERRREIRATAARYDRQEKRLVLDLNNGATLIVPVRLARNWTERLNLADTPSQACFGKVCTSIPGVHQLFRLDICSSLFGSLSANASKSTSKAKQAAARANGKRGGR